MWLQRATTALHPTARTLHLPCARWMHRCARGQAQIIARATSSMQHDRNRSLHTTVLCSASAAAASMTSAAPSSKATAASTAPPRDDGWVRCFVAIGSNAGHRARHIHTALAMVQQLDPSRLSLHATSLLYESTPVGSPPEHARQPRFLNAVIELRTNLPPLQLLDQLKQIEQQMGRDANMVRNGPRVIDLDILMYASPSFTYSHARLEIPHPRWSVRGFVLVPLLDLLSSSEVTDTTICAEENRAWAQMAQQAYTSWQGEQAQKRWQLAQARLEGADADRVEKAAADVEEIHRVIPFPTADCVPDSPSAAISDVWRWGQAMGVSPSSSAADPLDDASSSATFPRSVSTPTILMGILNLTPDSFSDGGVHLSRGLVGAVADAKALWDGGADIVDLGGESTRPGSTALDPEEELRRIIPVIDAIRNTHPFIKLSVDTYHPSVAREAVRHGCVMINDVYGGTFRESSGDGSSSETMLDVAASCNVPYVCMHMRGTAQSMTQKQHSTYTDVIQDVRNEQQAQVRAALSTRAIPAVSSSVAIAASTSPSPAPPAASPSASHSASTPPVASSPLYRWNLIADPGIGFAKSGAHAMRLLRHLPSVYPDANLPLLIGTSRKGFIANTLRQGQQQVQLRHTTVEGGEKREGETDAATTPAAVAPAAIPLVDRDWGTSATVVASIAGGATIIRVHDVHAMRCVRDMADQMYKA